MTRALARGLAFGLAPIQFGLAVTISTPLLDAPESLSLAAGCAFAHLVAMVLIDRRGRPQRTAFLLTAAFVLPFAAAFVVAAQHRPRVVEAWDSVVAEVTPAGKPSAPSRFGVPPPRAAPSGDPRTIADRLARWLAAVAAEAGLFLARIWVGTPEWAFVLAGLVGLSPERRTDRC